MIEHRVTIRFSEGPDDPYWLDTWHHLLTVTLPCGKACSPIQGGHDNFPRHFTAHLTESQRDEVIRVWGHSWYDVIYADCVTVSNGRTQYHAV